MQWYIYLITIAATTFLARLAAGLLSGPIRTAFYLRRESLAWIASFRNMSLPRPRELAITSQEIRDYDRAIQNLRNAQYIFADLGARFLAFGESEPTIGNLMMMFGLDMNRAGEELISLSQAYAATRTDTSEGRHEIEEALRSANIALKVYRHHSNDELTKIRLEPIVLRDVASLRRRRNKQAGKPHGASPGLRHAHGHRHVRQPASRRVVTS
jgi:hypothetical protein